MKLPLGEVFPGTVENIGSATNLQECGDIFLHTIATNALVDSSMRSPVE